jgi:CRP-like cAMP-binding protein
MFLISLGTVDVMIRVPGEQRRRRRVATYSAGTLVGEMGLLDDEPRAASVIARSTVSLFQLTGEAFERLSKDHPALTTKVVSALGRLARQRLRRANELIKALES